MSIKEKKIKKKIKKKHRKKKLEYWWPVYTGKILRYKSVKLDKKK